MNDDRATLNRGDTILAREKILFDYFNSCPIAAARKEGFDGGYPTGRPGEIAHVAESKIQQTRYYPGPNEAPCLCDWDKVIPPNYEIVAFCVAHTSAALDDIRRCYWVHRHELPSFPIHPIPRSGETSRNPEIPGSTENLASGQKPIFVRVDRMRLQFHDKLASQREDVLQAA